MVFHLSPIQDVSGNTTFIPSSSNNTDKSLLYVYWNDTITNIPNFSNIVYFGNYSNILYNVPDLSIYASSTNLTSSSNHLYTSIYNLDLSSSNSSIAYLNDNLDSLVSGQWITANMNNIYFKFSGNVGIGTSTPIYKLDIPNGNINALNLFINNININNIFISSNTFDSRSNQLYISISNLDYNSTQTALNTKTSQWITNQNSIYILNSNVGIASSSPNYSLDVLGNTRTNSSYFLNKINISNIFTTSNIYDSKSNNIITYTNTNFDGIVSTQWETKGDNIFLNKSGNVGIGTSNPNEKLDIRDGNMKMGGSIYPSKTSNYDLGRSNNKWRDIYLSGNSIYLDNIMMNKNGNSLEIKDSNLNNGYLGIVVNQLSINSNNHQLIIKNDEGISIGTQYLLLHDNNYDSSNIIFSNVLYATSNSLQLFTKSRFDSLNTDKLPISTSNRFITNDIYNRNFAHSGTLIALNTISSNLSAIGDTTRFDTTVYQTKQLNISNGINYPNTALIAKQVNINQNVAEFYNNSNKIALVINSNGNIGIGVTNPLSKMDMIGTMNIIGANNTLFISGSNINSIISSNIIFSSNNNYPILSNIDFTNSNKIFTYALSSSNHLFNQKQNILTSSSILLGNGALITNINYNNISNPPDLSIYGTTTNLTTTSNNAFINISNLDINTSNLLIANINTRVTNRRRQITPWITIDATRIYNNDGGFIGIGSTIPKYSLDVLGLTNINSNLFIKRLNISNYIQCIK
jgi:hypothetical protein